MGTDLVDVGWLPRSVQSLLMLIDKQRDVASLELDQIRWMRRWCGIFAAVVVSIPQRTAFVEPFDNAKDKRRDIE